MPVGGRRKAAICGLLHRPLRVATIPDYRMIAVVVTFVMDMLRGAGCRFVDVHDAHGVIWISKTRRTKGAVGKRERQRGHQDAKHVNRGKTPACSQSSSSRQSYQHRSPAITCPRRIPKGRLVRKSAQAKPAKPGQFQPSVGGTQDYLHQSRWPLRDGGFQCPQKDDIATKCSISWVCRPTEPGPRATRPVHRLNVRAIEGRRSASPDPGLPGGRSAPPAR